MAFVLNKKIIEKKIRFPHTVLYVNKIEVRAYEYSFPMFEYVIWGQKH